MIGCLRFLEGYYLLVVTKKLCVGSICGEAKPLHEPSLRHHVIPSTDVKSVRYADRKVYRVEATTLVPIVSPAAHKHHFQVCRVNSVNC